MQAPPGGITHPPEVGRKEVYDTVYPCRGHNPARGGSMAPINTVLNGRSNRNGWAPELQASLRSAAADRQWPQVQCFAAVVSPNTSMIEMQ